VAESIIGLNIGTKVVHAVEVEHVGPTKTLLAMDEFPSPFTKNTGPTEDEIHRLAAALGLYIKANDVKSRRVSVALDTSNLFLNTIPVDAGLSQEQMNEHLNWELSQYFPETPPAEFITDVHVLTENETHQWSEILSVSVRRSQTNGIRKAVEMLGLSLHIVDVDHFSAETALRMNYPDTNAKYLAMVGVKQHRLDVSLIRKGKMESYSYYLVNSDAEIVKRIGTLSRETRGIFSIISYGPHLEKDLLVEIRRGSSMLVEALNPLRHLRISSKLKLGENLTGPSYRFAAAVGVALRRD
jgi:Tfp pilus assembly PilM family ATPase